MRLRADSLGLTVACARCHDHKFDPIPTRDYYSLYSILSNIRQPEELPLLGKPGGLSPKQEMYQKRLERIQKEYQEYRVRRNSEMVAFFKTQTADYLLAAHDTETAEQHRNRRAGARPAVEPARARSAGESICANRRRPASRCSGYGMPRRRFRPASLRPSGPRHERAVRVPGVAGNGA